jgi:hypothetical protein
MDAMEQRDVICYREETVSSPGVPPAQPQAANSHSPHSAGKTRTSLIWGVGGTVLSVVGFIGMILFEEYNSLMLELRGDLKHYYETSGDLVKKESFHKLRDRVIDCCKDVQAANAARVQLEQELRASEKARDELARELRQMRERLAFIEGRQTATSQDNRDHQ